MTLPVVKSPVVGVLDGVLAGVVPMAEHLRLLSQNTVGKLPGLVGQIFVCGRCMGAVRSKCCFMCNVPIMLSITMTIRWSKGC